MAQVRVRPRDRHRLRLVRHPNDEEPVDHALRARRVFPLRLDAHPAGRVVEQLCGVDQRPPLDPYATRLKAVRPVILFRLFRGQ